ncbi:hypothetical protein [Nonomuraea guangzhouensis]|uniref:Uncharacterized protein n=1 Tax=Nonomuraea guangzhouensis TaxID=1291555 RepID=A0ABW4GVX8_9ACTN|nr:hypothetical protein [Nonomuraea guangzhouensis]
MTRYQVTAPCVVHVPAMTPSGPALGTYYQGAILPDGVPQEKLDHLLNSGMIRALDEPKPASGGEREEPAEKSDGASDDPAPPSVNSASRKADLIDYGIAHGGDRDELETLTRDQLLDRYVRQQS